MKKEMVYLFIPVTYPIKKELKKEKNLVDLIMGNVLY